jgi:hypothetical protein
MLRNLKLIFVHGVSEQTTNYSQGLFMRILEACRQRLRAEGKSEEYIRNVLDLVVQHEALWVNFTTDLTNRYLQLAYPTTPWFWGKLTRPLDPLMVQILEYVKDKGDKGTGVENILAGFDREVQRIFGYTDIGADPAPHEGHNAIIIAHSLGTVIAFDYIMGFRPTHELDRRIKLHSFVSMGSPIPIFTSAMGHPDSDITLPANVGNWTNIRSLRDGIARPLAPFFRNIPIEEHIVRTKFLPISAHSAYWRDTTTAQIIATQVLDALSD